MIPAISEGREAERAGAVDGQGSRTRHYNRSASVGRAPAPEAVSLPRVGDGTRAPPGGDRYNSAERQRASPHGRMGIGRSVPQVPRSIQHTKVVRAGSGSRSRPGSGGRSRGGVERVEWGGSSWSHDAYDVRSASVGKKTGGILAAHGEFTSESHPHNLGGSRENVLHGVGVKDGGVARVPGGNGYGWNAKRSAEGEKDAMKELAQLSKFRYVCKWMAGVCVRGRGMIGRIDVLVEVGKGYASTGVCVCACFLSPAYLSLLLSPPSLPLCLAVVAAAAAALCLLWTCRQIKQTVTLSRICQLL